MRRRHASWFFLMLLLFPLVVFGQAEVTGRITGKVTDDQGKPIAGATVEVTSTGLKIQRQATTEENGEFLFALLPTGAYTVTVSAVGRQPQVINLRLGIGQTVPLDVPLAPGEAIKEEITVTGTASALETTSTGERLSYTRDIDQLHGSGGVPAPSEVRSPERGDGALSTNDHESAVVAPGFHGQCKPPRPQPVPGIAEAARIVHRLASCSV